MLITASMGCRPIVWVSYYYSLRLYRCNHLQGNDASKIRVDDFISFLTCKNRDYFAFLHKSSGHRDTPHKTGTNPGKPGCMVTLVALAGPTVGTGYRRDRERGEIDGKRARHGVRERRERITERERQTDRQTDRQRQKTDRD